MADVNDLLVLTISISLQAIQKEPTGEVERTEYLQMSLGVGEEDAEDTVCLLSDIAVAVEDGRLYGWMEQHNLQSMLDGGDLRKMTSEEIFRHIQTPVES